MTMTLTELAAEVIRQNAAKKDLLADTRMVTLGAKSDDDPSNVLVIDLPDGAEDYPLRKHAHQQLAQTVDVPWKLYERLDGNHPDLLRDLTNGLLAREPEKRRIRILDGHVRAILSDRYRPRDNFDLLEHLLPVLGEFPDVQYKRCDLTETRLYVKAFLPGMEAQITPKVGDTVRSGVIISNSEVGSGSLYIYPYTDRLICTNGMVHTDKGERFVHLGKRINVDDMQAYAVYYSDETLKLDDAAFFAKCADELRACLNTTVFDAIIAEMRAAAGVTVPAAPPDAVKVLSDRRGFTEDESKSILHNLVQEGGTSAWAYANAVTATARDLDDADRATELEKIAGRMVSDTSWALAAA